MCNHAGGDGQITLKAGGEFHCAYICSKSDAGILRFDGGTLVKDGDVANQVGWIYGNDGIYSDRTPYRTGNQDGNKKLEVTANGGTIDIKTFNTTLGATIYLAEGVEDGVLTKRGSATLTLEYAASRFDGTFRAAEGTLALGTVGENTKAIIDAGTLTFANGTLTVRAEDETATAPTGKVVVPSGGRIQVVLPAASLVSGQAVRTNLKVETNFEIGYADVADVFSEYRQGDFLVSQSVDGDGTVVLTPQAGGRMVNITADVADVIYDDVLGADVVDVHKYGDFAVTLTAVNSFQGKIYIHAGTLIADRGEGIPMTANVVLAGGTWAVRSSTPLTDALGEGAGQLQVSVGNSLKLAAATQPGMVNLGGAAEPYVVPFDGAAAHTLEFNAFAGVAAPFTFLNPITYTAGDLILQTGAAGDATAVTLKGTVSNGANEGGHVYQRGVGTVNYEAPLALGGKFFCVSGGVANLASNDTGHVATDVRVDNATLNVADGALVDLTQVPAGWLRVAHLQDNTSSKTSSHLNVGAATITVGNEQYTYVGEDAGSTGTMTLDGSTVNTGFLTVGRNGTGEVTQNGGTVSAAGSKSGVHENIVLAAENGSSGTYRLFECGRNEQLLP